MPDQGIFKAIQKSERHNRKTITKRSFGILPEWIGSLPETPALSLFTNLFLSLTQAALKVHLLWEVFPDQLATGSFRELALSEPQPLLGIAHPPSTLKGT